MRLEKPRVDPLPDQQIDPEVRKRIGDGPLLNIFRTLAHHPKLLTRWLVFGSHILGKNSVEPRERELLIRRTGWLCRAEYEWAQHVEIARGSGLSDEEIERIARGADASGWSERDRALLRAVDELHADQFVSNETWNALSKHYETRQLMDLVFTVGQYTLVSMALNTLGVQLEPGAARFPQP